MVSRDQTVSEDRAGRGQGLEEQQHPGPRGPRRAQPVSSKPAE